MGLKLESESGSVNVNKTLGKKVVHSISYPQNAPNFSF